MMNPNGQHTAVGSSGSGKLRQWLIEQVDSAKYHGLVWEDDDKNIFRIPWKHAGKQDYNRDEDAALFKAWALFKGKYREGIDKPDPPTWKTRLRCALNKSNDFEELVERSQLDISDPYKVYRVIPEGAKKGPRSLEDAPTHTSPFSSYPPHQTYTPTQSQICNLLSPVERSWRDFRFDHAHISEPQHGPNPYPARWDHGHQLSGSFYSCSTSDPQTPPFILDSNMRSAEAIALSDHRLQVVVFYGDVVVRDVTVVTSEGCWLAPYEEAVQGHMVPGGPELVALPQGVEEGLERGVLIWMASDGLYALRLCPRKVYWQGVHVPCLDKNWSKLERELPTKLLDSQVFLTELQGYAPFARPPPYCQVVMFFEDLEPQGQRKTITVQVEPLFSRQLPHII